VQLLNAVVPPPDTTTGAPIPTRNGDVETFRANLSLSLLLQMRALGRPLEPPYNNSQAPKGVARTPEPKPLLPQPASRVPTAPTNTSPTNRTGRIAAGLVWSPLPSALAWAAALDAHPLGRRLEPWPFASNRVPPHGAALALALRAGPGDGSHSAWQSSGRTNGRERRVEAGGGIRAGGVGGRDDKKPRPLPLGFHRCESNPGNPGPSAAFIAACRGVAAVLASLDRPESGRGAKSNGTSGNFVRECSSLF
jgi:hypothetical protein